MEKLGELRDILKEDVSLYHDFKIIEKKAENGTLEYQNVYGDTLNGLAHIRDVESLLNKLIPYNIKKKFNCFEIYILLSAVYLHDIGKITKDYKEHPEKSKQIINDCYQSLGIGNLQVASTIADVAYGHGKVNIEDLEEEWSVTTFGPVRIRFLSALLRLADELSMSYYRAPDFLKQIFEDIKLIGLQDTKWKLRESISDISINPSTWKIMIMAESDNEEVRTALSETQDYVQKRLDELISVLEKNGLLYKKIELRIKEKNENKKVIEKIFTKRKDITPKDWQEFYRNTKIELDIMGRSMLPIFEKKEDRDIIIELLKGGCNIRVLILSTAEYFVHQQLEEANSIHPDVKKKIAKIIPILKKLSKEARKQNYSGKLAVKATNKSMYYAISRADNLMHVTPYSSNPEGDKCPTLLLRNSNEESNKEFFDFYKKEFERMWETGYYIEEIESRFFLRNRVGLYYETAKKVKNILLENTDERLPYPKSAIIYPTYQCSINCPHDMYRKYKSDHTKEMDIELFNSILNDLSNLGIENIELSGGGEPLEHSKIIELLEKIAKIKEENKKMKFGLITNGLHFKDEYIHIDIPKHIIPNFTYIRFSCPERAYEDSNLERRFFNSVEEVTKHFNEYTVYNRPRIGIKILATTENQGSIEDFIKKSYKIGVEHVKIKSIRGDKIELGDTERKNLEEKLYSLKFSNPDYRDFQIDLRKTKIPSDPAELECWINPMSTVIDPYGMVYICFNYHNDDHLMRIGNLNKDKSLKEFWGLKEHKQLIKNIDYNRICKACDASDCRFYDYQEIIVESEKYEKAFRSLTEAGKLQANLSKMGPDFFYFL